MAAKMSPTEAKKESAEATNEINMVVSDTEDDDEFLGDDLSSFDEGIAPPEKDRPDLLILNKKLQELEEAKKWKQANPNESNCIVKRPEQDPLHPNVYFDKYMGMKKLKAVEQKLKFTRGVLRRFAGKDVDTLKPGNRVKLQRAEKILASVVASHTGKPYDPPKHEAVAPSYTIEDMKAMNFRAKNRIIMAAKKFIPRIEAKKESERTPWEIANYPFYKEVIAAFPEPVKASPEEVQAYNKQKNAQKAERKIRHKEDQLDKALNFIDYLLKYKDQPFTPMTKAKLERSFEIIQKQFKFQAPPKLEPSKAQPTVISKDDIKKQGNKAVTPQQKVGYINQKPQQMRQDVTTRKRPGIFNPVNNARAAKMSRNDNNRGGYNAGGNMPRRSGGNPNIGQGTINRVADIWSSVGAALNHLSQSNNQATFGGSSGQPESFRRVGGVDQGNRDNFNNKLSDMLFNRGGNDGGRRYNDNADNFTGRNFNDSGRFNNSYNDSRRDDFGRGATNFSNQLNDDFRGNNDNFGNSNYNSGNFGNSGGFGGGNSGFTGNNTSRGAGNNYNDSGFSSGGAGYGDLDLNRGNRLPIDDLFTRNRSRY